MPPIIDKHPVLSHSSPFSLFHHSPTHTQKLSAFLAFINTQSLLIIQRSRHSLSNYQNISHSHTHHLTTIISLTTHKMPSIKQILILALATVAYAVPQASQISDGQIQAPTTAPVKQISDGQVQAPTSVAPVKQISDGQIQAPTSAPAPVKQISDGQIQAPTSVPAPVKQISDGQIQAPTSVAPVKQISDGQIQAPTAKPVTQITDGQIQVPTAKPSTGVVPPASNGTFTAPAVAKFTGAASLMSWSQNVVVAAVGAAAGLAML